MVIFSNLYLFNQVAKYWETSLSLIDSLPDNRIAVLLGGMARQDLRTKRIIFSKSSDRLFQSLALLKNGKINQIVISGGPEDPLNIRSSEAKFLKDYLLKLGFDEDEIIVEGKSRNTFENALFSKKIFDQRKLSKSIVLITSGFHMFRAKRCFEKQGFEVTPFITDPLSTYRPLEYSDLIVPHPEVLYYWNLLFKEWVGVIAYKLNNYI
ncbi:YdcF family protein [Cyclobacterium marinum]|uniref:DUF218 domain-containing protein n=1 Tax=Cyclobacterium marinum (strain ATCC 25205 / DSM 745 / LMG 13164 / NCIMB 1802) TaxID=880070 RepID=G0J674_CYCMS|nr:YdcF family protein [Cyclobacterium marinum]AEL26826.1 protein of unknown function DUF218 [Cyclobacterium marinum DSM 745]